LIGDELFLARDRVGVFQRHAPARVLPQAGEQLALRVALFSAPGVVALLPLNRRWA
jgi:hypothetical protein